MKKGCARMRAQVPWDGPRMLLHSGSDLHVVLGAVHQLAQTLERILSSAGPRQQFAPAPLVRPLPRLTLSHPSLLLLRLFLRGTTAREAFQGPLRSACQVPSYSCRNTGSKLEWCV